MTKKSSAGLTLSEHFQRVQRELRERLGEQEYRRRMSKLGNRSPGNRTRGADRKGGRKKGDSKQA